jgi:hypothetical protein
MANARRHCGGAREGLAMLFIFAAKAPVTTTAARRLCYI